jgi:uncharacterized protein (TIGR02594 family)
MKEPLWVSVMRMHVGIVEIPGPKSNPVILQWGRDIGAPRWFDNDDKAWCAVFMNRVLMACQLPMARMVDTSHPDYKAGFDLLRAATFEGYGYGLTVPTLGCLMTFRRPEGNHVGAYLGERADAFRIIGGNQSNTVNETWIAKPRLTAMRWPTDYPLTLTGRIRLLDDGRPVSHNEA